MTSISHLQNNNAIGNTSREISNRYDFKGSNATIDRKDNELIAITEDELKLKQVHDLIITHLVRRKVDPLCLVKEKKEKASNNKIRQIYKLAEGIEQAIAKKIVSDVKKSKIKVQIKINGNELRVEGKKKDEDKKEKDEISDNFCSALLATIGFIVSVQWMLRR